MSTWSETKRRGPAWRVRRAWNCTPAPSRQAGQGDKADPSQHPDRAPDVHHHMGGIGLQGDRLEAPPGAQQNPRRPRIDQRGGGRDGEPRATTSISCGGNRRPQANQAMLPAATRMGAPSTTLEKYSLLRLLPKPAAR
jgi:hypothetical protein